MNDVVIAIEGLGKQYSLSNRGGGLPYRTLRETMMEFLGRRFSGADGAVAHARSRDPSEDWFWALSDVSFEVKRGEVVGIIGRNGAGKSTLLKILSRITEPTRGRVTIDGRVGSLLEVGTGFHPELTGRENVYLNGAILGMRKSEIRRKFDEIVAFAEVERFLDIPVKRYSSGMTVRLAFAVAAHLDPEILVVDEVLAVGDIHFQRRCLGKMKDVAASEGRTVLFVSHNMAIVSALCQRGILLHQGKIRFRGETQAAVSEYLREGPESSGSVSYPAEPSKECQMMEVRVRDSAGAITSRIDVGSAFTFEIDIEVRRPMKGVYIGLSLFSEMQENILGTCDCDVTPAVLEERRPGRYRESLTIPARLLNSGRVSVLIGIGAMSGKIVHDRREVMQLELVDEHSFVALRGNELRPRSILLMDIPWTTTHLP